MLEPKSIKKLSVSTKYIFSCSLLFFRVFRRMKIKYRIITMKLCMRKCEIVKKIEIRIYVWNDWKKLLCICNVKKNMVRTRLFTGHFANGRYAISIIATYYIEMKKCFCSAWNRRTAVWTVPRKKPIPNFRPNSIGGFAVSEHKKPPSRNFQYKVSVVLQWATLKNHRDAKKSIGGFTVNKTDKWLKKFYRWFVGDFDWQVT